MEFNQIQDLIKLVSRSKISEVEIKDGDFKLIIRGESYGQAKQPFMVAAPPATVSMPSAAAPLPAVPAATAAPAPAQAVSPSSPAPQKESKEDEGNYITIKSPMVGTFYRSPSPDKPPFIKIGDSVAEGDTVCIIEAMKLFNEIESEISGTIVKVLVEDSQSVEYDQPLFLVDPA